MSSRKSKIVRRFEEPFEDCDLLRRLKVIESSITSVKVEIGYYVEIELTDDLEVKDDEKLSWILNSDLLIENHVLKQSVLKSIYDPDKNTLLEFGPRFNFQSPFSSNAVSICKSINLRRIVRLEKSRCYLIDVQLSDAALDQISNLLHDRMVECDYTKIDIPTSSFNESLQKVDNFEIIKIIGDSNCSNFKNFSNKYGLDLDELDMRYYTSLFKNFLKRDPTNIELFDLAQSNSEHSRHWFFNGFLEIDGVVQKQSLLSMISSTTSYSNENNIIKFSDNSSAIRGFRVETINPVDSFKASELTYQDTNVCLTFTAETHNFPTAVAPFSGAATGTGGRIRDNQAVGKGGHCIAATAGYCVGNLFIPGYKMEWEEENDYPKELAKPLEILIGASNGASDYGNKFGEPVIGGFTRSFGLTCFKIPERIEWIKPIMFSAGMGIMDLKHVKKSLPKNNMDIVKIGGPAYRIGVGGGSASSINIQGSNNTELDFNAVQRGDPEMEQKLNRVVRACIELGLRNPILSIHDQGAGGNGNVLKELIDPVGGAIYMSEFALGDPTMNVLELWVAEYQESNALLIKTKNRRILKKICLREKCPINFVGKVQNTGLVKLFYDKTESKIAFNLPLNKIMNNVQRKIFQLRTVKRESNFLNVSCIINVMECLERVLRLVSVGSKRFLTNKVDRCVTGLVAQQQCVGPLHTPIADVSVVRVSYFSCEGIATAIGEQPIKCLLDNQSGARMTVAEALTNIIFAPISNIRDIKCSGNWMWPAKLNGEGERLNSTCKSMCEFMKKLGIGIDGGKDSLSMAAMVNNNVVKSPGSLVISAYAPCTDIRYVVTPDFKSPLLNQRGCLLFVDLSYNKNRIGGSALVQCFQQLGEEAPDVENVSVFKSALCVIQKLISEKKILAGHDISDGGFIVCLLEMCFGGMCGAEIEINHRYGVNVDILFSEEIGWILEVHKDDVDYCQKKFLSCDVPCYNIGESAELGLDKIIKIKIDNRIALCKSVLELLKIWEKTSWQLERLQANIKCVDEEYFGLDQRSLPKYYVAFNPNEIFWFQDSLIKVAIIREEGSNGDREMAAALMKVGFTVWDVTMQDILVGKTSLRKFRGVVFPGGFSYGDVLGSAKGWAATIKFNRRISNEFKAFYNREDSFSLGVCNGCQLMALLNWVGPIKKDDNKNSIILSKNESNRFECRWSTVQIAQTNSIFFAGMNDSLLGIWVAHGEGKFVFREPIPDSFIPLRYVDDKGEPTMKYPFNPNGSVGGIAAINSENGRHLAMMPHPERCVEYSQWPWVPVAYNKDIAKTPWLRMFQNVYNWCLDSEYD